MAIRTIKKYGNRRLYDTEHSRYITLDELAQTIREGVDVRIVDAKTDADLTQSTLVSMILEGEAARLLPVPLLTQLVRMEDDALAEFFSKYVTMALEMYGAAKQGTQAISPFFPFLQMPMQAADAFMKMFQGGEKKAHVPEPAPAPESRSDDEVAKLREELESLKDLVRAQAVAAAPKSPPPDPADDA